MAAEVIILNSDSEGDDAAPFMDASLVAGWQHHPNPNAGASALQAIDLGSDSGEEEFIPAAAPAPNGRAPNSDGAASDANAGGDGSGAGSSDVRSDSSSSSSSSSGSDSRGGVSDRDADAALDLPLAPLGRAEAEAEAEGGGGGGSGVDAGANPAQPLVGEQRAAAAAPSPSQAGDVDNTRSDGDDDGRDKPAGVERQGAAGAGEGAAADKEVREGRLKGEGEGEGEGVHGGGGAGAGAADEEEEEEAKEETADADKEGGAAGQASAASSASVDPQDSGGGTETDMVVQENKDDVDAVAAGDSASSEAVGKSVGSASASGEAAASASAAKSVEAMIESLPPGFVKCPGCPMVYDLVPNEDAARGGGGNVATKDLPKGANLSRRSAMRHNGRHRFRCPSCSTCFCGSCRAAPYHIGFDCDGWKAHQAKPKCTFCDDVAEDPEVVADGEGEESGLKAPPCCAGVECRERANEGCRKKLPCGHPCRGPGGAECLPCIETGCPSAEVDGDDYCNICWTESLLSAPCVKLECGHFVHVSCGREQLKRGRPTARLTFGFMSCPVCRADKVLATHPHLGKFEGIPEQLTLAHEVEELAIQRLRADELPPLQRSSLESPHAGMRRRMAGLVRHRQRAVPLPLQMPYPPMHAGYQAQRRARGAGGAAGAGGAGRGRGQMYPMGPGGDWQPLLGVGMDWGIPPYVPMIPPPPYGLNNMGAMAGAAGAAGAGGAAGAMARAAAGLRAAVGAGGAPGAGRPGGAGGAPPNPASQEDYLHRKRQMLIAQADVAMKRAAAAGARAPGAARAARARGLNANAPVGRGRSPLVHERLEQQLEKGKAVLEERRRVRREARRELEDFPLPADLPSRSRRPQFAAGAGAGAGAGEAVEDADREKKPRRRLLPVRGSGDAGASARNRDDGDDVAVPNQPPRVRRVSREVLDVPVDVGGGDGDGDDAEKAKRVWGWGGMAGGAAAAAAAAGAAGQPSEEPRMGRRARNAVLLKNNPDAAESRDSGGRSSPRVGNSNRKPPSSAPDSQGDGGMGGDNGLADDWLELLQWPLRALGARPRRKSRALAAPAAARASGRKIDDDGDDDVVVLDDDEEDLAFASPLFRSKRKEPRRSGGEMSLDALEAKSESDDASSPAAAVVDWDEKWRAKRNRAAVKKRSAANSDASVEGAPEPPPKRVRFGGAGGFGVGPLAVPGFDEDPDWQALDRDRAAGRAGIEDQWLALGRAAGRAGARAARRNKREQEEREAAASVVDAVNAAARAGAAGAAGAAAGGGIDRLADNQRAGVGLAAARVRSRDSRAAAVAAFGRAKPPAAAAAGAAAAAAAAAALKNDDAKEGKGSEEGSAAAAAAAPPAAEQTKEERAEMIKRALKRYSYYQCHSCKKPYFGGLVSCEPAAPQAAGGGAGAAAAGGAAGEAQAAERALADIKPQELLCGKCSAGSGGASCSEHGLEFMEHKCYWCCTKVASYFCGGVMHFCDVCHLHGFAAKPKPCPGDSRCLFGGKHPDKARNGKEEYVLGCGICRPKPDEAE